MSFKTPSLSVFPSQLMLWLLLAWTLTAVIPIGWPATLGIWLTASALFAAVVLIDARAALPRLQAERQCPPVLALGAPVVVKLRLFNGGTRPRRLTVFDHFPQPAQSTALPQQLVVAAGGWAELSYQLQPLQRGPNSFQQVQVLAPSPLGLWRHNLALGTAQAVRVFPDFAKVARFVLLAHDRRTAQVGVHQRRRRGEGQDFLQLREYRDGDSLRQVDWKATARHRKLISKEYREERDQRVVFLLDCGRRMRARDGQLSHFDHVLNALLLLSVVALRQGDAIGLQCFAGERRWLAARKGPGALNTLINALYDLQPTMHAADYADAATRLLKRQRKRSLVVVLSSLRDEDSAELQPALALLRRRHLVILADLREAAIDQLLQKPIDDAAQAKLYAAACHYLGDRERTQERLRNAGSQVVGATPQTLPVALINQYLQIKRSGRL